MLKEPGSSSSLPQLSPSSLLRRNTTNIHWTLGRRRARTRFKGRAIAYFILAFLASFCLLYHFISPHEYGLIIIRPFIATCNHQQEQGYKQTEGEDVNSLCGYRTSQRLTLENTDEEPDENRMKRTQTAPHFPETKRRLPQCIIIGVRKCGTRALLEFLNIHPSVQKASDEVHFFDDDSKYSYGLEWYRRQMPYSFPEQVTIEKSPAYFVTDAAPYRIHAMNASIKLVLIIRDPVTRLISDYAQLAENKAKKERKMASFEDLVLGSDGHVSTSYKPVKTSIYSAYYIRWIQVFPSQQIHVVDGDRLVYDPFPEVQKVEQFLGLSHRITRDNFSYNATKGFYCVKVVEGGQGVEKCLNESKGRRHPDINPDVIQSLRKFYAPYNKQFYKLVGKDFGWPEF